MEVIITNDPKINVNLLGTDFLNQFESQMLTRKEGHFRIDVQYYEADLNLSVEFEKIVRKQMENKHWFAAVPIPGASDDQIVTMGNSNAKVDENKQKSEQCDPEIMKVFIELTNDGIDSPIDFEKVQRRAGPKLANSIWKWANMGEMSLEQFKKCANTLADQSTHGIIKMLQPPENLFECCFEAGGIQINNQEDGKFIQSIIGQIPSKEGEELNVESMEKWMNENCPRLLEPLREKMQWTFYGKQCRKMEQPLESEIFSPAKMFILRQSLPTTIFWPKPASSATLSSGCPEEWILLYSSSKNGLSINRFEMNVFEYRGPTLAIFQLSNGEIFAIAVDEEWRHSSKPFGGPNSILFKFHPKFERIDVSPPALYCNFKNRSSQMGIKYGHAFWVDEDMSNVQQIECWGCAGMEVLDDQRKMKMRHKLQAERNAKCPLPGKWEDNPDKLLLEMGGINFSNERRE